jgi:peptide/nickel transport system permease protein
MIASGTKYLPDYWWMTVFPGIALVIVVLGFNLLGDGIHDISVVEEI